MPTAYSYIRWSTPAQSEGDSLRRQTVAAVAYAERYGMTLDDSHRDEGVSGYRGKNRRKGALRRFLDAVEDGRIASGSVLLIENLDRLTRQDVLEGFDLFREIVRAGIVIVTLQDENVYSRETIQRNAAILMMAIMILSRGNEESKTKSDRIGAARRKAKAEARAGTRKWTKRGPSWAILRDNAFVPIPLRVEAVQRAFDLAEEGLAIRDIALTLNAEGHPAPTPVGWTREGVAKLLQNRMVLGEYQPTVVNGDTGERTPDGLAIPDYYPRIITPEQFRRVRAKMTAISRIRGPNGEHKVSNLFHGLTICKECGEGMGVHINVATKDGRHAALRCMTAHSGRMARSGKPCSNRKRINYPRLEMAILANVLEFNIAPLQREPRREEIALANMIAERDDLQARTARLLDLVMDGDPSAIGLQRQNRTRIDDLERAIIVQRRAVTQAEPECTPQDRRAAVAEVLAQLRDQEGKALYDLRARLQHALRGVVENVTPFDDFAYVAIRGGHRIYAVEYTGRAWMVTAREGIQQVA